MEDPTDLPGSLSVEQLLRQNTELQQRFAQRTHELEQALRLAEDAADAKANLLAVMTHELRNPLHAILGIAQLLESSPLDTEQRRQLMTMRECGDALLNLINDILDFSKLEAGRLQIDSTEFEVEDLHRQLNAMFVVLVGQRGLSLRFTIGDKVPRVLKGDPSRLRQVLVNLISNAIKFTERGGIIVRCELASDNAAGDMAVVRWSVTDTGIGIDADLIDGLFQPYAQAHVSIASKYGGTGLGLAICDRLVKAMGGSIDVRSVRRKGSRFMLTVPLALPMSTQPTFRNTMIMMQLTNAHSGIRLSPLHVLIVDDDPLTLMVTRTFVSEFGALAVEAVDGFDAIDKLQNHGGEAFDLVLMDMNMPGLDGPGATRLIRELPLDPQPYVIAVTANGALEDMETCRQAGMDDVLVKPYRREQLFEKLNVALESHPRR